ncbi:hypothetical protein C8D88_116138 [Lentzea atacamensis]|uniref:Uncharacterized protein n=1 Tax=Lentzea atacamensis TaxID=531938 RepID=A0A316HKF9_9PSEU|nr:hypothetical protein [Lentzea atacamensis]PWK81726.1 hypothetical protein C8D88_116138 [Lentzea atacamensis]
MPLDATGRARVWAHAMRNWTGSLSGVTKSDLQAAVNAIDDWVDTNQASFNTALPLAFRTNASAAQKALLFCFVLMRRVSILRTEED